MNYQNYLMKIHYPLFLQLIWHHAKMLYVKNNVTIIIYEILYKFLFMFKVNKRIDNTGLVGKHNFLYFLKKMFCVLFNQLISNTFHWKIIGLSQLLNNYRQYMVDLLHTFQES